MVPDVDSTCQDAVLSPLQDATQHYESAGETWNHCSTNFYCSFHSINPQMQRDWGLPTGTSIGQTMH